MTVNGDGYYTATGQGAFTVYDPSLGHTTGGGWFYWPGSDDPETGYPGDRTNFGYTMKYGRNGKTLKGNLLMIRHLRDGTMYRLKSNALDALALGEDPTVPMGWASFSGKATYHRAVTLWGIGSAEPLSDSEYSSASRVHPRRAQPLDRLVDLTASAREPARGRLGQVCVHPVCE